MSHSSGPNEEVVWRPSPEYIERSNLKAFMDRYNLTSVDELISRSSSDVAWFTTALLDYLDIQFHHPYSQIVNLDNGIQFPTWCVGGGLNITTNCLDKWLSDPASAARPALISELEEGTVESLTYLELSVEVNRCANALRALGFTKGDVVGLFLPMTVHVVVALLALARIGAIALPLFSGFGAGAIASRLTDAGAVGLITADAQHRRGSIVPMKAMADEALHSVPSVRTVIVCRRVSDDAPMHPGRDHWWHDVVPAQDPTAAYEATSAEDQLMIIYTSGTTGAPKGAVHTHCGFPVKAAQDMAFGTDVHEGDLIYWMTDMGWMMGPWLVFGSLLLGATCVIYDGAPDYPGPDRLWRLIERHGIHVLGLSPTLVRSLIAHGEGPFTSCDLSSLRLFASTGEPWNPDPWRWLFERVGGGRLPIINYSGGTEISGGIVMGNPLQPLKPTAFAGPCPGIAADVVDEGGASLLGAGRVGELVIRAPWIGMTRGFWKDRERYLQTYWSRWDGIWVHGDWAAVDEDGMWYLLGRSDDTINVAGKRVGPTEFESALVSHDAVVEAGAIGVPDEIKGTRVVCFCVLYEGVADTEILLGELMELVSAILGKPLKPSAIFFVADLPKTRNAKIMRRIIRSAYLGEPPGDTSSLVNAEALEDIAAARDSL
jgi:acetyl-CoA synthetase